MNLGEVLKAAHLTRNTYNTHVRRAGLEFMRRPYDGKASERYSMAHVVGIACFFELFRTGMDSAFASRFVSSAFDEIAEVVDRSSGGEIVPAWLHIVAQPFDDDPWRVFVSVDLPVLDPARDLRCTSVGLYGVISLALWRAGVVKAHEEAGHPIPDGYWPAEEREPVPPPRGSSERTR